MSDAPASLADYLWARAQMPTEHLCVQHGVNEWTAKELADRRAAASNTQFALLKALMHPSHPVSDFSENPFGAWSSPPAAIILRVSLRRCDRIKVLGMPRTIERWR